MLDLKCVTVIEFVLKRFAQLAHYFTTGRDANKPICWGSVGKTIPNKQANRSWHIERDTDVPLYHFSGCTSVIKHATDHIISCHLSSRQILSLSQCRCSFRPTESTLKGQRVCFGGKDQFESTQAHCKYFLQPTFFV